MATVDVLVPTYNRPAMLRQCLVSIRAQTYTDIEVTIGDDGVDGNTRVVAQEFCRADCRFHYVRNAVRLGIFGNTNALLTRVTAPYVHIMHDDDWLEPTFYDRMIAGLEESPEAGWALPGVILSQGDSETSYRLPERFNHDQVLPAETVFEELVRRNFITFPAVVCRAAVLHEAGPFAEYLTADRLMWMRLALHYDLKYIHAPLFHRRVHAGQEGADGIRMGKDVIDMFAFAAGLEEFSGRQTSIVMGRFNAVCTYMMIVKEAPQAPHQVCELSSYFLRHVPDHHGAMRKVEMIALAYTIVPAWLRPRTGGKLRRWFACLFLPRSRR